MSISHVKSNGIKYLILLALAFTYVFIFSPTISNGCSCIAPGPPLEELERSSAVFSGKVIEITDANEMNETKSSADPIAVLFEVEESWKGIDESQVMIYTVRGSETCGFVFKLNEDYLVYSHQDNEGKFTASLCSRTMMLNQGQSDLAELGAGNKVLSNVVHTGTAEQDDGVDRADGNGNGPIDQTELIKDSTEVQNNSHSIYYVLFALGLIVIVAVVFIRRRGD